MTQLHALWLLIFLCMGSNLSLSVLPEVCHWLRLDERASPASECIVIQSVYLCIQEAVGDPVMELTPQQELIQSSVIFAPCT